MTILAAYLASFILAVLAVFQLSLVLGLPYGEFAWGGQHKILPQNLKISSLISIILYLAISLILLSKAGVLNIITNPELLRTSSIIIAVYFTTGIPLNLISRSKKERFTMTPIVTILAILAWLIV